VSAQLLRTEAVAAFGRAREDMLTLVTMQAVDPWNALGQADERNFNVVGCMGSAASVGLGLALAKPNERVLVLDGDGSLLMQLGSLVSIADRRPSNLYHAVFENGIYETSGGQSVPGRQTSSLAQIALASGYRSTYRFDSVAGLDDGLAKCLRQQGPVFISLAITGPGVVTSPAKVPNKATQIQNMRAALSAGRSAGI
jgi:thiamine pyrophosphate-dependent acetolactate synthase large subunit-like protein